jgi:hypothetical protein
VGGGSGEEGGELGGEEDNGVEGETSTIIGPEGRSIGTDQRGYGTDHEPKL